MTCFLSCMLLSKSSDKRMHIGDPTPTSIIALHDPFDDKARALHERKDAGLQLIKIACKSSSSPPQINANTTTQLQGLATEAVKAEWKPLGEELEATTQTAPPSDPYVNMDVTAPSFNPLRCCPMETMVFSSAAVAQEPPTPQVTRPKAPPHLPSIEQVLSHLPQSHTSNLLPAISFSRPPKSAAEPQIELPPRRVRAMSSSDALTISVNAPTVRDQNIQTRTQGYRRSLSPPQASPRANSGAKRIILRSSASTHGVESIMSKARGLLNMVHDLADRLRGNAAEAEDMELQLPTVIDEALSRVMLVVYATWRLLKDLRFDAAAISKVDNTVLPDLVRRLELMITRVVPPKTTEKVAGTAKEIGVVQAWELDGDVRMLFRIGARLMLVMGSRATGAGHGVREWQRTQELRWGFQQQALGARMKAEARLFVESGQDW